MRNNYRSVLEILRARLEEGVYGKSTLMPAEEILAAEFGVSRPTIAKVYGSLIDEGLIARRRGVGTIVLESGRQQRACRFGMLLPGAGESEIFSEINSEIMNIAQQQGFDCEWGGATANNAETRHFLAVANCERYIEMGIDGVFFSPLEKVQDADRINNEICRMMDSAGVPTVLIDRDIVAMPERSRYDVVGLDNYTAGAVMAHHMIDAGCRNIYFFNTPFSAHSVDERLMAVKNTVTDAGLDFFRDSHVCCNPGRKDVLEQMAIIRGQTGIICANDSTAVILMSTLEEQGYKCGVDYLISGFDNMKYSLYLKTPLTTYAQPCKAIARLSVELMLRRVREGARRCADGASLPVKVLLNGEIVARESTRFLKNKQQDTV